MRKFENSGENKQECEVVEQKWKERRKRKGEEIRETNIKTSRTSWSRCGDKGTTGPERPGGNTSVRGSVVGHRIAGSIEVPAAGSTDALSRSPCVRHAIVLSQATLVSTCKASYRQLSPQHVLSRPHTTASGSSVGIGNEITTQEISGNRIRYT